MPEMKEMKHVLKAENALRKSLEKLEFDFCSTLNKDSVEGKMVMNVSNTLGVCGKTEYGNDFIARTLGGHFQNVPTLDHRTIDSTASARFSTEYLVRTLEFFKANANGREVKGGKVAVTLKSDFPVIIEDEDFKMIIAPRADF